jgi:hypothetical protein
MARRTGPRFIGIAVGVHARASPHRLVNENNGRGRPGLFRESAPAATGARRVARAPYAGNSPARILAGPYVAPAVTWRSGAVC